MAALPRRRYLPRRGGINDALALANADGTAVETGTDVPMSSAPVTIVDTDLRGIASRAGPGEC
jgi:cation transport ATPase